MLREFVYNLYVSNSDGSKSDDSEGSTSEGLDYGHDTSGSDDNSNSRNLSLKSSASDLYSIPIADLSCQHQT